MDDDEGRSSKFCKEIMVFISEELADFYNLSSLSHVCQEPLKDKKFLVVSHDSIRGYVRPSLRRSVRRPVRRLVGTSVMLL